ncbi:alpha/beta fold hydrolase [Mobilicoccus caccae]|uniref:Alpha/beta hydrolase n=1 Tax=Mobilicoccus caccae TaxID=1859295 RepID=A0ABQ6IVD8_9MICO|nr:alpha/beta hydrolase [Mobilicoccus caccae]GMA41449.1 alpha/beta hydrolase [Mobilicoccus caccae]
MFEGYEEVVVDSGGVEIAAWTSRTVGRPPLVLLHGHPQTHLIWHRVASDLAEEFDVVACDLRGYGASGRPPGGEDHAAYSKRVMAADVLAIMRHLGHERFAVAAHDRGARVAARLVLDEPEAVSAALFMDIAPTLFMYENTDRAFAHAYWHWFFLTTPAPMAEQLLEGDPRAYVESVLAGRHAGLVPFPAEILDAYVAALTGPGAAHGMCEDYRAAATIDLEHDRADLAAGHRTDVPLRVLWGRHGIIGRFFEPLEMWGRFATTVSGREVDCGHYIPEEAPAEVLAEIRAHLAG